MTVRDDDDGAGPDKGKPEKPIKGFSLPPELRQMFEGDTSGPGQAPPPPKDWPEIDPATSELPADCPVTALGVQGRTYFYLNAAGQLVELLDREHGPRQLLALFGGGVAYLEKVWPKYGAPNLQGMPSITGWRQDLVVQCLMLECNRQGPWNSLDRMRGPGAWSDDRGRLIMHFGDEIQIDGESQPPGVIDKFVYEAGPKWPHPAAELAPGGPQGPGALLLDLVCSWNWSQPDRDPYLELGHMAASKIGGALPWRPAQWIVGEPGSGKSTFEQKLLMPVYGANGVIRLIDPTEAGIRQINRYSSLPTIVDELEAGADRAKVQRVVMLARYAASGGATARGSASHIAFTFVVQCCYTFSSVYAPPLNAQDRSRILVQQLLPLARDAKLPVLTKISALGRLLTRRMIEQWPRFAPVFECFREALRRAGHSARSCDQFGTLASCMFLALHDGEPYETPVPENKDDPDRAAIIAALRPDDLAFWVHRFQAAELGEESDDTPDPQRCLDYLLGSLVDPRRAGERRTIGQLLEDEISRSLKHRGIAATPVVMVESDLLDAIGLKLVFRALARDQFEPRLLVANAHRGLFDLFDGSPWRGSPAAGGAGWTQALRRLPGAEPGKPIRFGGVQSRVTDLSLRVAFGLRDPSGKRTKA